MYSTSNLNKFVHTVEEIPHVTAENGENPVVSVLTDEIYKGFPHLAHQLKLRHLQHLITTTTKINEKKNFL